MLEQITSIFSILASISGVIALFAVLFQLRQNNRVSTSSAYQNLTSTFNQFIMSIAQDEKLIELYTRGRYHPETLKPMEKERFFFLASQMYGFHENLYILREIKSLPSEFYDGWKIDLMKNLEQPGFLLYWQEQGDEFSSGFQAFLNRLIKQTNPSIKVTEITKSSMFSVKSKPKKKYKPISKAK